MAKKTEKKEHTIEELVYAEKAVFSICKKYENSVKNYDGSISQDGKEYQKYKFFNDIHHKIINKMEELILNEYND
jgi:Txe/YoeB family toxin of Txe-Axe toxin-antitoxin module